MLVFGVSVARVARVGVWDGRTGRAPGCGFGVACQNCGFATTERLGDQCREDSEQLVAVWPGEFFVPGRGKRRQLATVDLRNEGERDAIVVGRPCLVRGEVRLASDAAATAVFCGDESPSGPDVPDGAFLVCAGKTGL